MESRKNRANDKRHINEISKYHDRINTGEPIRQIDDIKRIVKK
jgi:hypothetical protein